ncbi:MAG: hypothetical protein ILA11_10310 [Butyrivibrio sp.]|nr:hypothetical protein [Butyrivibrio sp.]
MLTYDSTAATGAATLGGYFPEPEPEPTEVTEAGAEVESAEGAEGAGTEAATESISE